jgi:hypothetical protein
MATNQTHASIDEKTRSFLEQIGVPVPPPPVIFTYSVKIVCGKQTGTNCCCIAGTRPGLYATEVNIQNFNYAEATVWKFVQPLINLGAVVAREPNLTPPPPLPQRQSEKLTIPAFAATMDDCCKIADMLTPQSGETPLTIAILSIMSTVELSVSAVYTANPLTGDGISIDVEYIPSQRLGFGGPG